MQAVELVPLSLILCHHALCKRVEGRPDGIGDSPSCTACCSWWHARRKWTWGWCSIYDVLRFESYQHLLDVFQLFGLLSVINLFKLGSPISKPGSVWPSKLKQFGSACHSGELADTN